jgi:3-oxoacyl-[acyl-carrier protein] reductase
MRLAGKVAIVTGGGSGFGEGIVKKFVAEGASVVLMDRDGAAASRVAGEAGDKVRPITGDVSTLESFAAAADLARSAFGGLDILVNNAGVAQPPLPLETIDEGLFDRIANVNMRSIYNGARAVVPHFKSIKSGAILNVASTGGVSPRPNLTWYNASRPSASASTRSTRSPATRRFCPPSSAPARKTAPAWSPPFRSAGCRRRRTWATPPRSYAPTKPA